MESQKAPSHQQQPKQQSQLPQPSDYPVPLGMNRHVFQQIFFDLPLKYQPIKLIGKGTYGAVISAVNLQTKQQVAIKRLTHIDDIVSFPLILLCVKDRCKESLKRNHHHEELCSRKHPQLVRCSVCAPQRTNHR